MLHRWCHLHVEHECSAFKAAWFVLYLQMGAAPALDFSTVCNGTLPVVTQTEADFERLYGVGYGSGGANGTRYWEQAKHAMSSLHEVAFHAIHGSPGQPGSVAAAANPPPAYLRYSKLWVFEQGNLFSILATFATMRHDFLGFNVFVPHNSALEQGHQGQEWARVALPEHLKSWVFAVRYSRRLLDTLAFDFAARGLVGWCEWFAPSVCRYQERLTQLGVAPYGAFNQPPQYPQQHRTEWPNVPPHVCTLADYGSEAYLFHPKRAAEDHNLPATFGGSAPGRPGIPHITDTEANFAYSMAKPGQLFHSVKF